MVKTPQIDALPGMTPLGLAPQHGYKAFYNQKQADVYAPSLYAAKLKAIEHFKAPKSRAHMVTVMLCERADGSQVIHSTASL